MRIRLAIPDELDDQERKDALDAALESVTRSVTGLVRRGIVPPAAKAIKGGQVRWQPEPPGDEHFDLPTTVLKRGWGDCDDLAPWHAATLRASGTDPSARAVVKRSGPSRWHALVERSDGSIEDPSRHAGMGATVSGPGGGASPIHKPMSADSRLCIALCPSQSGPGQPITWFARCDAPDECEPWDWSAMRADPSPKKALLSALNTVHGVFGDDIDDLDRLRLETLHGMILGCDADELGAELEHLMGADAADELLQEAADSVGFFGGLVKAVTKPLAPLARAVSPLASAAAPIANKIPMAAPAAGLLQSLSRGDPRAFGAALSPQLFQNLDPRLVARTFAGRAGVPPQTQAAAQRYAQQYSPIMPAPLRDLLSLFQQPGWAPPTVKYEPGSVVQPRGPLGTSFMVY